MEENKMPLLQHLEDLRRVLIVSVLSLIPTSVVGWVYKEEILDVLMKPLLAVNDKITLQILGPTDAIFAYLKMSVAVGIILASPIILWQIWGFVLPALRESEQKMLRILVPASVLLFVLGILFAYFTVFQIGTQFFLGFGGDRISPSYTMNAYLSFAVTFLLPFGVVFELPIVVLFLTKIGLVTPKFLAKQRRMALLIIFIIAAFLTPGPDIVSQFLMAAPMYILYELSIWLSHFVKARKKPELEVEAETEAEVIKEPVKAIEAPIKPSQEEVTEATQSESAPETIWVSGGEDESEEGYTVQPTKDVSERKQRLEQILTDIEEEKEK